MIDTETIAHRTQEAVTILGQSVLRRVWRCGAWCTFEHTESGPARHTHGGQTCWTSWVVHRLSPNAPSTQIVAGLSREVALHVIQDMNRIDRDRFPDNETTRLADLQAVLRSYLGGFAL